MSNGDIFLMTGEKIQVYDQSLKQLKSSHNFSSEQNVETLQDVARSIIPVSRWVYYILSLKKHFLYFQKKENIYMTYWYMKEEK